MALSPLKSPESRAVEVTRVIGPSKTYDIFAPTITTEGVVCLTPIFYDVIDTDTYEIGGIIDGLDAIRQFIRKAIVTARGRFMIYDMQYGSEIEAIIGQDVPIELLQTEIPRMIREAIIYDDRIESVSNFALERSGDQLIVTFDVKTTEGVIKEGVVV